jgi:hypothetical protein
MKPDDLFLNLKFRESQLQAIVKIYEKYFEPEMPKVYDGRGVIALWYPGAKWETGKGDDRNHNHVGIISDECRSDALWQEFEDLLPHMSPSATITKMPPGNVMRPHVDRKWRPEAIYFPIRGCTGECISEYYDLPKIETDNSQGRIDFPEPAYTFAVKDKAILTNVHEWHGVKNNSKVERIAIGWNMKIEYSFEQCKTVLKELGYTDVIQ